MDTVPELAQRNAQNLFDALTKTNAEKKACASDAVTQRGEKLHRSGEGHAARAAILKVRLSIATRSAHPGGGRFEFLRQGPNPPGIHAGFRVIQ